MDAVGVARCPACQAIINVAWSACAACHAPVPKPEAQTVPSVRHHGMDWLGAWRDLAALTDGIARDDPRFQPVIKALDDCDAAFAVEDWNGFQQCAVKVRAIVGQKGAY